MDYQSICRSLVKTALFLVSTVSVTALNAERPAMQSVTDGIINRHYIFSPQLNEEIAIDVWTPSDYHDADTTRFQVLYMHDGQNLYDATTTWNGQSWEMDSIAGILYKSRLIPPTIIVGIHSSSETRVGDLMPEDALTPEVSSSINDVKPGTVVRGNAYADFVVNTLKPQIDSLYFTHADPEHTFVMGSSMGGLMSAYLLCKYPETFGGAGCLSTHWIGSNKYSLEEGNPFAQAMYDYLNLNLPESSAHKIYHDHGTETLDAMYGHWDDKIDELLQNKGYCPGATLMYITAERAAHDEKSWRDRVAVPLTFLLNAE